MRKYTFTEKGHTFKRIDKKTARTAYKNGLTVIICPCNLRPFTPWHSEHRINRKDRAQVARANTAPFISRFASWTGSQVKHPRPPHWEPWSNTIIAICSSKPQPRTASPPAGAYFIEWRYKALEKSMDNAHGGLFHTLQGYVKTAAFAHSRHNGQRKKRSYKRACIYRPI